MKNVLISILSEANKNYFLTKDVHRYLRFFVAIWKISNNLNYLIYIKIHSNYQKMPLFVTFVFN